MTSCIRRPPPPAYRSCLLFDTRELITTDNRCIDLARTAGRPAKRSILFVVSVWDLSLTRCPEQLKGIQSSASSGTIRPTDAT